MCRVWVEVFSRSLSLNHGKIHARRMGRRDNTSRTTLRKGAETSLHDVGHTCSRLGEVNHPFMRGTRIRQIHSQEP